MAGYRRRRRISSNAELPEKVTSDGLVDVCASVEERLKLAEDAGKDFVYMEWEKPNGRKVQLLMSAEAFKGISKVGTAKLYRGLS